MLRNTFFTFAALAGAIQTSSANLLNPLTPEEGAAEDFSKRFQPALDFDMDSCYHVTALDINANFKRGSSPLQPQG